MAYRCGYVDGYNDFCTGVPGPLCTPLGFGSGPFGVVGYAGSEGICGTSSQVITIRANVLNIDNAAGRLGCGVPSFFITRRCSNSGVECVLDKYVSSATWDRRLDDVSEAVVTCEFSGTTDFTCCECLAETEPWCSELHIWRDGIEVWVGPIQTIEYTYNSVTITANDSLAWMNVRIPPVPVDFTAPGPPGPMVLTDIAQELLELAFAEDSPTYTCEIDNIFKDSTGLVPTERFFEGYNQTALEILLDLADTGLNFTVLGRTIVLVAETSALTPLVLLNDEHIIGDIKVTKDGTVQGNRYYVHFEGDGGVPASSEAEDFYCYGPIERMRDGDGLQSGIDAADVADIYVQASAIAPRTIEVPSGSKLSPDTPWTINQMVPGTRVDVALTKLCLNLTQSFYLTMVEASYDSSGGEAIGITLVPINSVTVAGL